MEIQKMSNHNENNPSVMRVALGVVSADTVFQLFKCNRPIYFAGVHVLNGANIAQDDTDYVIFTLKKGTTTIASFSTKATGGDGALVADTWQALTVVAAEAKALNDEVITFEVDVEGGGALDADALLALHYYGG